MQVRHLCSLAQQSLKCVPVPISWTKKQSDRFQLYSLQVACCHAGLTEVAAPALALSVGASVRATPPPPRMPAALSEGSSEHPKSRGCWVGRGLEQAFLTCVWRL